MRAAIVAGGLLVAILVSVWALRTVLDLPAFLPHVEDSRDFFSNWWRTLLGFAIIAFGFGIPLFLLILRNSQLRAARKAVRAREDEFRAYAEAGSDWLWTTDALHRISSVLGGHSAQVSEANQHLIGKTLAEVVGSDQIIKNPQAWRQFYTDIDAHRPFRNFEVETHSASGRRLYLSLSGVPTFDETGAFTGYRGVTADITKRKNAELAREESERRFGDFAKSASDWFWETDTEHRFVFSSDRIRDTLGVPSDHGMGKTRFEMASRAERSKRPDAWRQHLDDLKNCRPFRNFEYETELDNGERHTILTSGVPVFEPNGRFVGYRGSATDVTETRQTERESLEYLRQFKMLADNLPILIAHFDADWRFLYVNRTGEIWFNRPRSEMLGRPFAEIAGNELDAASVPSRQQVLAGETVRQETVTHYPDGKTRTVLRTLLPDFQPGEPPRIHVMVIDVTEQRHLEEQVRQNLKMEALGNLTGGVAHDFNNLLLAIQGNLEFLCEEPLDPTLQAFVGNALRGVDRAADLTRRLLAFARQQPLTPRTVDVGDLLADMQGLLRRTLEAYVEIEIDTGDEPACALVDPGQLENAVLNLAINARDAMPGGGTLTLRVRGVEAVPPTDQDRANASAPSSPFVCIEVVDTGAGMADSIREHAFEPFFTTKQVGHGTGLGLAMVHGFVTQSGGFAEIESDPGAGTTVRLYLPTADAMSAPEMVRSAPAVQIASGGSALLIEDDEMVRTVTARHLSDLGYQVVAVASPDEAMATLDGPQTFDLLLSDLIVAGGLDGLGLAERARTTRPDIGVVLMSGYADFAENRPRADALNARLIAKPFSRAQLADTIIAAQRPAVCANDAPPLRAAG